MSQVEKGALKGALGLRTFYILVPFIYPTHIYISWGARFKFSFFE